MIIALTTRDRGAELDLSVEITDPTVLVGRLGVSLGLGEHITIDGHAVAPELPVSACGLASGALIARANPDDRPSAAAASRPVVTLWQIGGLAAGGFVHLTAGRHAVGSIGPARAELRSGSVTAARFVLDVSAAGRVRLEASASDQVVVDGVNVGGPVDLLTTNVIDVGSALMRVEPYQASTRSAPTAAGRIVVRPSRHFTVVPEVASVTAPSLAGLRRRERNAVRSSKHPVFNEFRADLMAARKQATRLARGATSDVGTLRIAAQQAPAHLWTDLGDGPIVVSLGHGDPLWSDAIETGSDVPEELETLVSRFSRLPTVPIGIDLRTAAGGVVTLAGPRHATLAVARWVVLQLASKIDPASLAVRVASETPARWDWTKWLPHTTAGPSTVELLILDGGSARTEPVGATRFVVRIVNDLEATRVRTPMIHVDADGHLAIDGTDGLATGVSETTAVAWARALAPISAPTQAPPEPPTVRLDDLCGLTDPTGSAIVHDWTERIGERWRTSSIANRLIVPFAADRHGPVALDLTEQKHTVVSGPAGSGRSTALNTIVMSLCLTHRPDQLDLVLIDGGSEGTFRDTAELPQARYCVSGESGSDVEYALSVAGRAGRRCVIVIDDATTLSAAFPGVAARLADIARRSDADALHLILASRRPDALFSSGLLPRTAARLDFGTDADPSTRVLFGTAPLSPGPTGVGQARWSPDGHLVSTVQVAVLGPVDELPKPAITVTPLVLPAPRPHPTAVSPEATRLLVQAVTQAAHQASATPQR
jgi:DNA segregation ATPase FtsK/SpoIIIE, S-DNA-T family